MRISITNNGNFRNRGCEALAEGILCGLESQPEIGVSEILVHTGDPGFDQWRLGGRAHCVFSPIGKWYMPHTRSFLLNKLLCLALANRKSFLPRKFSKNFDFFEARKSDLIICTGGDNFSMDYGAIYGQSTYLNLGVPVFLCAQSLGPFSGEQKEYFRRSCKNVCLMTVRESHSYGFVKELGLSCPVEQTADVAYLLPSLDRETTLAYARKHMNVDLNGRKLIGLSISELITKYYKYGREEGVKQIAAFIDGINDMGYSAILIPHVCERTVDNDDQITCLDVLRRVRSNEANVAMTGWFSCIEAKSIIGLCDILIGARTHATIASLSQGIPTVSIAYSRKAYGIMEDYYGQNNGKKLTIPADQVYAERLMDAMKTGLEIGQTLETAARMKKLAMRNFELLSKVKGEGRRAQI